MNKITSRASNMELLRIVAMLMIIIYHIIIHCVNIQLTNASSIEAMDNGWFNNPIFYKQLLFIAFLMPFGLVGNALFIMISGYFLEGKEIGMLRISKKLLSQLLFAAIALVMTSFVFIATEFHQRYEGTLFSYIRIQYFNRMSWFVGYYFIIILMAYLGLNKFLSKLDKNKYLVFLLTALAISQLSWSGSLLDDLAGGLRTVLVGVFFYALGGYIRRFNPFEKVRGYVFALIIVFANCLIGISYYNTVQGKIQAYYYNLNPANEKLADFTQSIPKYENYSIVIIILGICMFEIFRRINMPSIKLINLLASPTFMIYLLHDNGFAYSLWETQDWITLLYFDFPAFVLKLIRLSISIFAIGLVAYYLYLGLMWLLKRFKWVFVKE